MRLLFFCLQMCFQWAFPSTASFGSGERRGRDLEKRDSSGRVDWSLSAVLQFCLVRTLLWEDLVFAQRLLKLYLVLQLATDPWAAAQPIRISKRLRERDKHYICGAWILKVLVTRKKKCNYVRWWMLTKLIAIILQYIHISNHFVIYLILTQGYILIAIW